ncbi:Similar to photosystem I assembly BtpA [Alloactinosynnema sp. L-07]|uniref:BtpA/SgcQ family protein n=1 Tax=Alloactinosynnema sp. L-07 TaxID=1653480 RepID=UPI00065F082C|nr:BtpA/SgcQ family protein [Alloactinosynnema sp. L-07]CRK61875.1 Similar to photosystem I assembly BtpA [Alloactinosynnema sp. L-07]
MIGLAAGGARKLVLGMVHLPPLPGTPFHDDGTLGEIVDTAVASAAALRDGGADGCLVQTVDRVYSVDDDADPARVAAMSLVVRAVADATGEGFAVGAHMLRNAVRASLAVAKVAGGSFVRVGAIIGQTMTAQGLVAPDPMRIMAYRNQIGARDIRVIADIDSMHFRWHGADRPVGDIARNAVAVGADAVCLGHPDERRTLDTIEAVRAATPATPVILAGHTTHENVARLLPHADGAFVGSCLESGGWGGRIDGEKVKRFVDAVRAVESR